MSARATSAAFLAIMGFATGLTLLRSYVFAGLMEPAAFGRYASVIATGAFCGTILSYGLVERSLKAFPGLYIDGRVTALVGLSRQIERRLALRAVIFVPVAVGAGLMLPGITVTETVAMVVFAWFVAACSAGASLLRAAPDPTPLAYASLIRAGVALVIGAAGAVALAYLGAISGEMIAAAVFLGLVVRQRRRMAQAVQADPARDTALSQSEVEAQHSDGRLFYFATLFATAPIYLDRLAVRFTAQPEVLGTYALLATLVLAATALVGIIAQIVGPRLIHMRREDPEGHARRRRTFLSIAVVIALLTVGAAVGGWLLLDGPFDSIGAGYQLSWPLIGLILIVASGQCSVLLDWLLISLDRERQILIASLIFFVLASGAFGAFALLGISLEWLLALLGGAKGAQILVQIWFAQPGRFGVSKT